MLSVNDAGWQHRCWSELPGVQGEGLGRFVDARTTNAQQHAVTDSGNGGDVLPSELPNRANPTWMLLGSA